MAELFLISFFPEHNQKTEEKVESAYKHLVYKLGNQLVPAEYFDEQIHKDYIHETRESPGTIEKQHAFKDCLESRRAVLEHHLLVGKVGEGDRKKPGQNYCWSQGNAQMAEQQEKAHVEGCSRKTPYDKGENLLNC